MYLDMQASGQGSCGCGGAERPSQRRGGLAASRPAPLLACQPSGQTTTREARHCAPVACKLPCFKGQSVVCPPLTAAAFLLPAHTPSAPCSAPCLQATTPLDPRVVDAMLPFMTEQYGNPHSRTHLYGWEAEDAVELARSQVGAPVRSRVSRASAV